MNGNKLAAALGLAARAGKIRSGDFITEKLLKGGKAKVIILDTEASAATEERYTRACERMGARLIRVTGFGRFIGKPGHIAAAVTDRGFEQMILRAAEEPSGDN